jgi:hypothetical protein
VKNAAQSTKEGLQDARKYISRGTEHAAESIAKGAKNLGDKIK